MDIVTLAQQSNLQSIKEELQDNFAHVAVSHMTLGGIPSVFINVSLDDKEQWTNGIFQNSRFAQFVIHDDLKIEQMTKRHDLPKFRKVGIKSVHDLAAKVIKWKQQIA